MPHRGITLVQRDCQKARHQNACRDGRRVRAANIFAAANERVGGCRGLHGDKGCCSRNGTRARRLCVMLCIQDAHSITQTGLKSFGTGVQGVCASHLLRAPCSRRREVRMRGVYILSGEVCDCGVTCWDELEASTRSAGKSRQTNVFVPRRNQIIIPCSLTELRYNEAGAGLNREAPCDRHE